MLRLGLTEPWPEHQPPEGGAMLFTAHRSDTDCDGTTFNVGRIEAETLAEAEAKAYAGVYDVGKVEPEADFYAGPIFAGLSQWEQDYYRREGYASTGARWNPWVYDDTIGISALDHTYDEPVIRDADIEQAAYEYEAS